MTFDYLDESGQLLFQVVRREGKRFSQRRPDGNGGWLWNLNGARRVLFRLPALVAHLEQNRPDPIYVVEGEKDVLAIEASGATATCNPGGAGKWSDEYSESLRGARRVVLVADLDEPGARHARQVRESLATVGIVAELVQPREGKDASDHLAAGFGLDEFVASPVQFEADPYGVYAGLGSSGEVIHGGPVPTFMPAAHFVRLARARRLLPRLPGDALRRRGSG
jgi:putative DNA primase/helicase